MSNLNKYLPKQSSIQQLLAQEGGEQFNPATVVEKGEYIKNTDGNVLRVSDEMPTHDDKSLIEGDSVTKVKKGKGGVALMDIMSVISATQENRRRKDSTYTDVDESIKISKDDIENISSILGLKVEKKAMSPAKLLDNLINSREKLVAKYSNIEYTNSKVSQSTELANLTTLNNIPNIEVLFDTVLELQESKKENVTQ